MVVVVLSAGTYENICISIIKESSLEGFSE
jgi:hypothetical protein